ncbi:MAG: SprT-like domain-containing protein [Desulforhopalus sp.]
MKTDVDDLGTLPRLWLRQLQLEFDEICAACGVDLPMPIFEITNSKKEIGGWCSATATLRLSQQLIWNVSWSVTQQVLRHEMAHQLCSIWRGKAGTPHGEAFQEACEILGVLPEYRRREICLSDPLTLANGRSSAPEQGRGLMAKVEKLLALAESSNAHEAALAMEKATALIEKYHLEKLDGTGAHRYAYCIIDRKRKRIEGYQRSIATILQNFFFVRVVLSRLYDPQHNETYRTIELFGTRENVAIGEYCYYFLENRLSLLWANNGKRFRRSARAEKNSFYLGILRGFSQKLETQKKSRTVRHPDPQLRALVRMEDEKLARYMGLRFPRLKKVASRGAKVYRDTFEQGVKAGKTISFAEGVTQMERPGGGLLS